VWFIADVGLVRPGRPQVVETNATTDPTCPAVPVNGGVAAVAAFAAALSGGRASGRPMTPKNRCEVW
jgi:hypothetical protein